MYQCAQGLSVEGNLTDLSHLRIYIYISRVPFARSGGGVVLQTMHVIAEIEALAPLVRRVHQLLIPVASLAYCSGDIQTANQQAQRSKATGMRDRVTAKGHLTTTDVTNTPS